MRTFWWSPNSLQQQPPAPARCACRRLETGCGPARGKGRCWRDTHAAERCFLGPSFLVGGTVLLLDGLERLTSIFQAEKGRLALCVPWRGFLRCSPGCCHQGQRNSTSCPVQGHNLARHPCHSRGALSPRRALPGAADTKPQGRGNTATALAATARVFAGLGHLLSRRIEEAENKVLISLRL